MKITCGHDNVIIDEAETFLSLAKCIYNIRVSWSCVKFHYIKFYSSSKFSFLLPLAVSFHASESCLFTLSRAIYFISIYPTWISSTKFIHIHVLLGKKYVNMIKLLLWRLWQNRETISFFPNQIWRSPLCCSLYFKEYIVLLRSEQLYFHRITMCTGLFCWYVASYSFTQYFTSPTSTSTSTTCERKPPTRKVHTELKSGCGEGGRKNNNSSHFDFFFWIKFNDCG